jgi:hypothetical protein
VTARFQPQPPLSLPMCQNAREIAKEMLDIFSGAM